MGALWKVLVTKKHKNEIHIKVNSLQGDVGGFPEDEPFVLCLLASTAYEEFSAGVPNSPLGHALPYEEITEPYGIEEKAFDFIEDMLLYETCNLPWTDEKIQEVVASRILARGVARDDENWHRLFDEEWKLFWSDPVIHEPHLAFAYYRIRLFDPKWIEHLEEGMVFESYASASGAQAFLVNRNIKRSLEE